MRIPTVSILALFAMACSDPQPTQPAEPPEPDLPELPAEAPAASWSAERGRHSLEVTGQPTWIADLTSGNEAIRISFMGAWPPETTARVGEVQVQVPGETLEVSPYGALGDVTPWEVTEEDPNARAPEVTVTPAEPLVVRLSNGVEMSVPLPEVTFRYAIVHHAMEHAAEHGLTFAGEGAHEGPHRIYRLEPDRSDGFAGSPERLRDIDWIARVETEVAPGDGTTCPMAAGGELPLERETDTVTIVDRRTGEQVQQRVFEPDGVGCPTWAFNGRAIAAPTAAVQEWLEELAGEG